MPVIGFICPDGHRVTFKKCFNECRLFISLPTGRCKALPLLRKASQERIWNGEPSTTQLIQGTREAWLKITRPYYINPDDRILSILGTNVHNALERLSYDHMAEERLRDEICSGIYDFYDIEMFTLWDYKAWGAYKTSKALGIKRIKVPKTDDQGNPVLLKSGKNKGQPKMETRIIRGDIATKVDGILEAAIQLSNYRDKLNSILPAQYKVRRMAIQIISRESGAIAEIRGLTEKAPVILVNGISRYWVEKYLHKKKEMLLEALEKDSAPVCHRRERWDGRKCKSCEVREYCTQLPGWETVEEGTDQGEEPDDCPDCGGVPVMESGWTSV